jgi:plastocyanin
MWRHAFLAAALFGAAGLCATVAPAVAAMTARTSNVVAVAAANPTKSEAQITIDNFSFSPPQITVAVGTRVTWTNRDDIPHTVVDSDDPRAMKSEPLDTGEDFAFTFDKPGTYRYFCSLHPHMQGMVVVQ